MKKFLTVFRRTALAFAATSAFAVGFATVSNAQDAASQAASADAFASLAPEYDAQAVADVPTNPTLPDWATAQIDETFDRFKAWKGDDAVFAFPVITDIHSSTTEFADPINWADSKTHIYFVKAVAAKFDVDFIADLGDMGLDWKASKDAAGTARILALKSALYRDAPKPVVFALGNHDHNSTGVFVDSKSFGERFNGWTKSLGVPLQTGPNSDYGYLDFPEKKTRLVFLNTSDDGYYGYSREQLQFLADSLASAPKDFIVTVIQHFCMYFDIGMWTSCPDAKAKRDEQCMRMLSAFVRGTAGEEDGVVWDFSARGPGKLVGVFCGDSHFDNFKRKDDVNYFITQGYGGVDPKVLPEGAVVRPFARDKTMLLDVVATKPAKGETKIFRVGIGGADADRESTY